MRTLQVPENILKAIDKYFHLEINGITTITPYYINYSGFLKSPVMAGKGTAQQIQEKAKQKILGKKIQDEEEAYELLQSYKLGIDCSGFVYRIYENWIRSENKDDLSKYLPKVPLWKFKKYFSRKLKPASSVSANEFTSPPFAKKIEVKEIKPGDLIRTQGGKHVLFIYRVDYDKELPVKIFYAQSTKFYNKNGMKYGEITLNKGLNLADADWKDIGEKEENHTYRGYRILMNQNGIFRPKLPIL